MTTKKDTAVAAVNAEIARKLVEATAAIADERTIRLIKEFFDEGEKRKRFVDVSRIPFICDNIIEIHESLKAQNQKIDKLIWMVGIGSGIVITVAALLKWIVK